MNSPRGFLLLILVSLLSLGAAKKQPGLTVRFHVEANAQDTERFSSPVQLRYPPRAAYIEKIPSLSERNIKAIYPFKAADGTWGCAFQLDNSGRVGLEVLSTERRGSALVVFTGTKTGSHQVIDMLIDRPIKDGIVTVQHGLTDLEMQALRKQYPLVGQPAKR